MLVIVLCFRASENFFMCCSLKRKPGFSVSLISCFDTFFISVIMSFCTVCHSSEVSLSHRLFRLFCHHLQKHSSNFVWIKFVTAGDALQAFWSSFSINSFMEVSFDWHWNILTLLKNSLYIVKSHSLICFVTLSLISIDFRLFRFGDIFKLRSIIWSSCLVSLMSLSTGTSEFNRLSNLTRSSR